MRPGPDDGIDFAERLLGLIDTTRYTATYKLATLIAIIDLAEEHSDADGGGPRELSGLDVGRRVVELYWPQTAPFLARSNGDAALTQSSTNDIPAKLYRWRSDHSLGAGATVIDARAADPAGWDLLGDRLAATVVGMPLAKLQRFGDGRSTVEDRFLYDFGWADEVKPSTVLREGFDDTIRFQPGVTDWLIRLGPLLRPLIHTKWTQLVAARNTDVVDAHQLDEFLFGASRISLDRVRWPLVDLQHGRCFYCDGHVGRAPAVDHFLPWSRHPDNTLHNLVVADPACNGSKSAMLAGVGHLDRWLTRFDLDAAAGNGLAEVAAATNWPHRAERTLSVVRANYLLLKPTGWLWRTRTDLEPVDTDRIRAAFNRG